MPNTALSRSLLLSALLAITCGAYASATDAAPAAPPAADPLQPQPAHPAITVVPRGASAEAAFELLRKQGIDRKSVV